MALTHFRTRNNRLFVQTGSWGSQIVPYEERHCAHCNSRDIEEEYHFLLICTLYSELRNRYIPKYYRCRPSVYKFVRLMQTEYSPLLCNISAFVFHAFKIRNQILYNKWYCIAVPPNVVYVLPLYTRQAIDAFKTNWIESMSDFNHPIDSLSSNIRQLTGILDPFDLNLCVNFLTHIHGHTLDLIILSSGYQSIKFL